VAIKIGERPALNSPRTQSRSRLKRVGLALTHIANDSLFFVSVYRQSGPTVLPQIFRDVVSNPFGPYEDQDLCIFSADLIQVLDQFGPLLEIAADLNDLLDVVVGSQLHGTNVDLDHILQEVLQKSIYQHEPLIQKCAHTLANFWTSFGHVALNIRV